MRRPAIVSVALTAVLMVGLSAALTAQIHEDTRYGFKFKPPKDFNAVALKPGEYITVAKYQDSQTEYGGAQGAAPNNRTFQIQFWPFKAANPEAEEATVEVDEEDEARTPAEQAEKWLDATIGFHSEVKTKKIKVGRTRTVERHLKPDDSEYMWYAVMLEQGDGVFLFLADSFESSFSKSAKDYAKAVKSFKRIEKDQSAAEGLLEDLTHMLGKDGDQEKFLQNQIDKLPPGWDSLRTDHYLFLYNADSGFVDEMASQIEAIRNVYESLFPPERPMEAIGIVRVCNSHDEYLGYGGRRGTGGYFSSLQKELVFFDYRPRSLTLAVLNHEAFHQYIYHFYGELSPHSWYNEGHGDYFAGAQLTRSGRVKGFGDAEGGIGRKMGAKEACRLEQDKPDDPLAAVHLKDLMRYSQAEYYARSQPGRDSVHYAQGWALVHMLREAKGLEPAWESILDDYLVKLLEARDLVAQETMEEAIANAEEAEEGSGDDLSREVTDWYAMADQNKIQDRAYELTFQSWTDEDWDDFNDFYLEYVEKL